MKHFFFGPDGRLREGAWAGVFLIVLAACGLASQGLGSALLAAGVPKGPWRAGLGLLAVLAATWFCTRRRGEPLSSVGLVLDGRWLRELGWGTAFGAGQVVLATTLLWAVGGVRLELDPARSVAALGRGLVFFFTVSLIEEMLFRGFLFQRLCRSLGVWPAQLGLALLFALAHWGNPGMEGATRVYATLDIVLGALLLGLGYLKTRSLALPVGMHLGWNWAMGHVLGFAVSGGTGQGWFRPVLLDAATWLTGGSFGLEASVFAVVADATAIALLLAWKGSVPAAPPVEVEISLPAPVAA